MDLDLNAIARMTGDELLALPNLNPAPLTTNANTWNCVARDLLAYAAGSASVESRVSAVTAANAMFAAAAERAWHEPVTIALDSWIGRRFAEQRGAWA